MIGKEVKHLARAFSALLLVLQVAHVGSDPTALNVAPIYGEEEGGELTTKTVFGFGDYVTTIGSTVMLFTPQGVESSLGLTLDTEDSQQSSFIEVERKGEVDPQSIRPSAVQHKSASTSLGGDQIRSNPAERDQEEEQEQEEEEEEQEQEQEVEEQEEEPEVEEEKKGQSNKSSSNTLLPRFKGTERKSAISSLKERLKERFEKSKLEEEAELTKIQGRKSSKAKSAKSLRGTPEIVLFGEEEHSEAPRPRTFRSRNSSPKTIGRSFSSRDEQEEEDDSNREGRDGFGRSSTNFGRRQQRPEARPESRPETRPSFSRSKLRDSLQESSRTEAKISVPKVSFKNRGSSRNEPSKPEPTTERPEPTTSRQTSFQLAGSGGASPKVQFKAFNKFDRPDIRKNLLNKFLKNRPEVGGSKSTEVGGSKSTDTREEVEKSESSSESGLEGFPDDHESSPSALVPSIIQDEDQLQNIEKMVLLDRLQTTLLVSTVYPQDQDKDNYLEVATIRSPYTFMLENSGASTRYITVTRTFAKSIEATAMSQSIPLTSTIKPTKSFSSGSTAKSPIFDTKSIPAPENILATPDFNEILEGNGNIETLPAVILPSTLFSPPPFKTVTETFSTNEHLVRRSLLPVIIGSETSFYTLSQTYTVTRLVTAVKTIPPMEFYEFSPSKSFTDFDALFEGAGSENREQLLPGELEFSDQDNFGLDGPAPVRVTPPPGFFHDLDLIGAKLDFVESMERKHNPGILQLKNTPHIDSSIQQIEISPSKTVATPVLQLPSAAAGLNISPEQLLYLQLLQNPLAALGLGGGIQPQVVTESAPVYRTETVYETNTIKLFQGAKEFSTVLTTSVGITTITDFALTTRTVSPGLGLGLGGFGGNPGQGEESPSPLAAFLQPSFTVISSPVIKNTVKTETHTQEIKIIFRNTPTLTKITSTSIVSTQVTEFVTRTQRVAPSLNPLAGLLG